MVPLVCCPGADGLIEVSLLGDAVVVRPAHKRPAHLDLAVALCCRLGQQEHLDLRRSGWIAWGGIGSCGALIPATEPLTNDLPPGPCVGQIWHPDDHLPSPEEDAVLNVVTVADLDEAWDALHLFAGIEDVVFDLQELARPIAPARLRDDGLRGMVVERCDLGRSQRA